MDHAEQNRDNGGNLEKEEIYQEEPLVWLSILSAVQIWYKSVRRVEKSGLWFRKPDHNVQEQNYAKPLFKFINKQIYMIMIILLLRLDAGIHVLYFSFFLLGKVSIQKNILLWNFT